MSAAVQNKIDQLEAMADKAIAIGTTLKNSVTALRKELEGSGVSSGSPRRGAGKLTAKAIADRKIRKQKSHQ